MEVGAGIGDDLLAVLREELDGDRIAHGACGNEEGGGFAGDRGFAFGLAAGFFFSGVAPVGSKPT